MNGSPTSKAPPPTNAPLDAISSKMDASSAPVPASADSRIPMSRQKLIRVSVQVSFQVPLVRLFSPFRGSFLSALQNALFRENPNILEVSFQGSLEAPLGVYS